MNALLDTGNYRVEFDGEILKSTNLNTGKIFEEEYFMSIQPEDALNHDFNLLLNTWDLLDRISLKHMKKETKENIKLLEKHISLLVDIHMGRD
ncbi:hypothetical protein [Pseudalkalibacillus hwajinpoensis]|uniref:Uncharacterized protein n=1 Tax=Guptibacillus hwajinpoensis TaxID=208199 RepID=A0A4U1MNF6_9BACL|nr:hypothetical protein [Pseudalkalibacillus hwajinpoensis]TKD72215.1 hypothetical protein FBF83_05315 [Pseudalkalibacillus hwajinpoensis]